MSFFTLFQTTKDREKNAFIETVIEGSAPKPSFFVMMGLASIMATLGLLINNNAIIIGSMLIAPLLYPLLSLGLGIVIADWHAILRSLYTISKSMVVAVFLAGLVSWLFPEHLVEFGSEVLERAQPSVEYALVALVAGFAAAFAMLKPSLNEHLPGVAISVALIPPLAVIGIAIAAMDPILMRGSLELFLINILCVTIASALVFSLMQLSEKRLEVKRAIKKEDKQ